MPCLYINPNTWAIAKRLAPNIEPSHRLPDGRHQVWLSYASIAALQAQAKPGEALPAVLHRRLAAALTATSLPATRHQSLAANRKDFSHGQ